MSTSILVVEDTPANLKLFTLLLRTAGHEVLQARSAEEALEIARNHRLDLVLMDVQLPGMDGLAATGILKSEPATRHLRIVALTALAMKGDAERIAAAGCDGYIAKPVEARRFAEEVARQLALAHPA